MFQRCCYIWITPWRKHQCQADLTFMTRITGDDSWVSGSHPESQSSQRVHRAEPDGGALSGPWPGANSVRLFLKHWHRCDVVLQGQTLNAKFYRSIRRGNLTFAPDNTLKRHKRCFHSQPTHQMGLPVSSSSSPNSCSSWAISTLSSNRCKCLQSGTPQPKRLFKIRHTASCVTVERSICPWNVSPVLLPSVWLILQLLWVGIVEPDLPLLSHLL